MSELIELAERLERAGVGGRLLDRDVLRGVKYKEVIHLHEAEVTTSLDAIVRLIEEKYPRDAGEWVGYGLDRAANSFYASLHLKTQTSSRFGSHGFGATMPLALCVALLRAVDAQAKVTDEAG